MIKALTKNSHLEHLEIHDNWLKEEAIDLFCDYLAQAPCLKKLNVSDCDIGGLGVWQIIRALSLGPSSKTITHLNCHYNDLEHSKTAKLALSTLLTLESIKSISLIGNLIKKQLRDEYIKKFNQRDASLIFFGEGEEELEEDDEELEELSDDDEDEKDGQTELSLKFESKRMGDLSIQESSQSTSATEPVEDL